MANRQEIVREIDKLNKSVEDASLRKEEALLELGIFIYKKVREGLLDNEEINEKCESIIGFDHVIYDSKVKIDKFNKQLQGIKCSCGAILTPEDRFVENVAKKLKYLLIIQNI